MRKIKSLEKSFFAGKVLRALGVRGGVELSLPSKEEKRPGVSAYCSHNELRKAKLEAIQAKAVGMMEYQRQKNLPR